MKSEINNKDILIAKRLKVIREIKNLKIEDIARYINLSDKELENYENGESSISAARFLAYCKRLKISAEEMLYISEAVPLCKAPVINISAIDMLRRAVNAIYWSLEDIES